MYVAGIGTIKISRMLYWHPASVPFPLVSYPISFSQFHQLEASFSFSKRNQAPGPSIHNTSGEAIEANRLQPSRVTGNETIVTRETEVTKTEVSWGTSQFGNQNLKSAQASPAICVQKASIFRQQSLHLAGDWVKEAILGSMEQQELG